MARADLSVAENVPGEFFVDETCIDCATCRQLAPQTFAEGDGHSYVHHQPENPAATHLALMALVACPTSSIGSRSRLDIHDAAASFPQRVEDNVHFCGFTAQAAFGAWSWFIQRPEGNVLVDSPRFNNGLVKRLEELGGVRWMFLTHQDDVADHEKFHAHFGCERIIHRADAHSRLKQSEQILDGRDPIPLAEDLLVIPTPGHTRGHCVLLHKQFLFSGDHLHWDEDHARLHMWRSVCWYSWEEQLRSLRALLPYRFSWVLPGHGPKHHASPEELHAALEAAVARLGA